MSNLLSYSAYQRIVEFLPLSNFDSSISPLRDVTIPFDNLTTRPRSHKCLSFPCVACVRWRLGWSHDNILINICVTPSWCVCTGSSKVLKDRKRLFHVESELVFQFLFLNLNRLLAHQKIILTCVVNSLLAWACLFETNMCFNRRLGLDVSLRENMPCHQILWSITWSLIVTKLILWRHFVTWRHNAFT